MQASAERALKNPITTADILRIVAEARSEDRNTADSFSYFNPILQFGLERFADESAGVRSRRTFCDGSRSGRSRRIQGDPRLPRALLLTPPRRHQATNVSKRSLTRRPDSSMPCREPA
ncbi:MAG: tryptophan synthase subunit alpha [Acidobacteria bacterium]|nr:tryptophan synthase subunit alpha [Acidobacteriota bacterium]